MEKGNLGAQENQDFPVFSNGCRVRGQGYFPWKSWELRSKEFPRPAPHSRAVSVIPSLSLSGLGMTFQWHSGAIPGISRCPKNPIPLIFPKPNRDKTSQGREIPPSRSARLPQHSHIPIRAPFPPSGSAGRPLLAPPYIERFIDLLLSIKNQKGLKFPEPGK